MERKEVLAAASAAFGVYTFAYDRALRRFQQIDPQFRRLFKVPYASWDDPGFFLTEIHPEDASGYIDFLMKGTPGSNIEIRYTDPDSQTMWMHERIVACEGNIAYGVGKDISSQKLRVAVLREQRQTIADLAHEASKAKMASAICHEIGNVLTALTGRLHRLESGQDDDTVKDVKQCSKMIRGYTNRMARVMRSMRLINRPDSKVQDTDVRSIVVDIAELVQETFGRMGVEIAVEVGENSLHVPANDVEVGQILMNLAKNACEAAVESDDKRVILRVEEQETDVLVVVEDHGKGLETGGKPKGMGVGLKVCRQLADRAGGEIRHERIQNGQGGLTRFCLRLPKDPAEHLKPLILIVDDEPVFAEILAESFVDGGCRVVVASSGQEAYEVMKFRKIAAVISDIRMPDGTGVDLVERAYALLGDPPPLFLMTGYSGHTKEEIRKLGAKELFFKPFSLVDVVNRVLAELHDGTQRLKDAV